MAELFQKIVTKEFVATLGIDMSLWGDEEQSSLHEGMILAMKENPDWTEEEVKEECKNQVDRILFDWFQINLGLLVKNSDGWENLREAYKEFRRKTLKDFMKSLTEHQRFRDFCDAFYDDLREMYNICSAGMWDEYERMKINGWSMSQYRKWLDKQMRKN